jgi:hypothetical protein
VPILTASLLSTTSPEISSLIRRIEKKRLPNEPFTMDGRGTGKPTNQNENQT